MREYHGPMVSTRALYHNGRRVGTVFNETPDGAQLAQRQAARRAAPRPGEQLTLWPSTEIPPTRPA